MRGPPIFSGSWRFRASRYLMVSGNWSFCRSGHGPLLLWHSIRDISCLSSILSNWNLQSYPCTNKLELQDLSVSQSGFYRRHGDSCKDRPCSRLLCAWQSKQQPNLLVNRTLSYFFGKRRQQPILRHSPVALPSHNDQLCRPTKIKSNNAPTPGGWKVFYISYTLFWALVCEIVDPEYG